ncbi:MAG: nicotinamide riboside transporter PnuC [Gammaproteobacteria bacterium]|nr:MAG: nicotinamide riboside transporter PnuC [Gammaproteobacteria bacterium]
MNNLYQIFNIHTVFFTFDGYRMSYLECLGTLFNFYAVYLVARNNILTWPIGSIGAVLFGLLFYQIQLYSEVIEQIYFLAAGFYGWWIWWSLKRNNQEQNSSSIKFLSAKANIHCIMVVIVGTLLMGYLMSHINVWLPARSLRPASVPYLDAFVTMMSFAAVMLMTYKKVESWYWWIAIDVVVIGLYFSEGILLMASLYALFLFISIKGAYNWQKWAV